VRCCTCTRFMKCHLRRHEKCHLGAPGSAQTPLVVNFLAGCAPSRRPPGRGTDDPSLCFLPLLPPPPPHPCCCSGLQCPWRSSLLTCPSRPQKVSPASLLPPVPSPICGHRGLHSLSLLSAGCLTLSLLSSPPLPSPPVPLPHPPPPPPCSWVSFLPPPLRCCSGLQCRWRSLLLTWWLW
jgi:hypothetical protein